MIIIISCAHNAINACSSRTLEVNFGLLRVAIMFKCSPTFSHLHFESALRVFSIVDTQTWRKIIWKLSTSPTHNDKHQHSDLQKSIKEKWKKKVAGLDTGPQASVCYHNRTVATNLEISGQLFAIATDLDNHHLAPGAVCNLRNIRMTFVRWGGPLVKELH